MIIDKYEKEISDAIRILESIKSLSYSSINVYGSSVNEKLFEPNYSDIDLIVMCRDFNKLNLLSIVNEITLKSMDFKAKKPIIIEDSLCKRIEFYINFDRISIDVTISPSLIPSYKILESNAWYDSFESLMGGVYLNSYNIYGKIPDYDIFKKEFYPFYSDELRTKRLDLILKRLIPIQERIQQYIDTGNPELVDFVYKVKKHFIKWLYIYYRTYYLTPEKHTYYQLKNLLNINNNESQVLSFLDGDIFTASSKYLKLSNDYIEKYKKEKKLIK